MLKGCYRIGPAGKEERSNVNNRSDLFFPRGLCHGHNADDPPTVCAGGPILGDALHVRWRAGGAARRSLTERWCPYIFYHLARLRHSPSRLTRLRTSVMLSSRPVSRSMRLGASARIAQPALTSARTFASTSARGLATPQDTTTTPVRHYGGLKDQDRCVHTR